MEIVRLTPEDCRLFSARFAEHGNSHRRMTGALGEAGATAMLERIRVLRRLEARFEIDLGSLCHRFQRRDDAATHPLERLVLNYVATWRRVDDGGEELWVLVDRVRALRELIEAGDPVGGGE